MESLFPFIIVAVVLVVAVLVFSRRSRDTAELSNPVRLGPSWSPPEDELADDPSAAAQRDQDLAVAQRAVDLEERAVTSTLEAWWEYLAVLKVRPLPRGHRYRFYDPYDPPVTELGPDGPVPDPVRVARDVAQRTSVAEIDALAVLGAVARGEERPASEPPGGDRPSHDEREGVADRPDADDLVVERDEPVRGGSTVGNDEAHHTPSHDDAAPNDPDSVLDDPDSVLDDPDDVLDDPDDAPRR